MNIQECYGYSFDINYLKENHPEIADNYAMAILLMDGKETIKIKELADLIGNQSTTHLLNNVMEEMKNKIKNQ